MDYYEDRNVAFIDILGFKNIVKQSKDIEVLNIIDELHKNIHADKDGKVYDYRESFEFAYFSDCIVLSCLSKKSYGFIQNLMNLQIELLRKGVFIRGCITKGDLYHSGNKLFGPALIEAYESESSIAKYPRIILGKNYKYIGTYFAEDYDGIYFIDFCRHMQHKAWNKDFDLTKVYLEIMDQINNSIESNKDNESILMKYNWTK